MKTMSLEALFNRLDGIRLGSWAGVEVSGIGLDSRRIRPGDLFVVLEGRHTHGIRHLDNAIANGAVAVLLSQSALARFPKPPLPGLAVADPRSVLPRIAARLNGHPGRRIRITGVTGTNGKTSTVFMLHQILSEVGMPNAFWSTAAVGAAGGPRPSMTTPEAPELQHFLAEAVASGAKEALLEVSSHGIVLHRIGCLDFQVGIVTNLTPDHLDFHGSFEAYQAAKRSFIASLAPTATAVLNGDDAIVSAFGEHTRATVWRYGTQPGADIMAHTVRTGPNGSRFTLTLSPSVAPGCPTREVVLPVGGMHNVYNALAALSGALALGADPDRATAALAHFRPPVRRMETQSVGGCLIINDVAMNRASYEAVMEAVRSYNRPLVVVSALRGNRGTEVNREIAVTLAKYQRMLGFAPLIVTESRRQVAALDVDYRVRPEETRAFIEEARRQRLPIAVHCDLEDAVAEGVARLKPGGVLLLLGTFGMDEGARLAARMLRASHSTDATRG